MTNTAAEGCPEPCLLTQNGSTSVVVGVPASCLFAAPTVAALGQLNFCYSRVADGATRLAPTGRKSRARASQRHQHAEVTRSASCCKDSGRQQSRTATARWKHGNVKYCSFPASHLSGHTRQARDKNSTEAARARYHNRKLLLSLR